MITTDSAMATNFNKKGLLSMTANMNYLIFTDRPNLAD